MKKLDLQYIKEHLPALVTRTVQTDHEVRKKAQRVLYLMRLLEDQIITEEILSVPREEWDIGDEIAALCDGSTPVAQYIFKTDETRRWHNRCYQNFRYESLPRSVEYV